MQLPSVQRIVRQPEAEQADEGSAYLRSLLQAPLAHACSVISLTGPLNPVRLQESLSLEGELEGSQDFAGQGAARPRIALVHVANEHATLLNYIDMYAMWLMTHWAYSRAHGYDLLLHCPFNHMTEHLGHPHYFFLKALALRDILFVLSYDYALYLDWDTVRNPWL